MVSLQHLFFFIGCILLIFCWHGCAAEGELLTLRVTFESLNRELPLLYLREGERPRQVARTYLRRHLSTDVPDRSLVSELENRIVQRASELGVSIPTPTPPLISFKTSIGERQHDFSYWAGTDPALATLDFLDDVNIPPSKLIIEQLNRELSSSVLQANAAHANPNKEMFTVPIKLGSVEDEIKIYDSHSPKLAANAFCIKNVHALDSNDISVAQCTLLTLQHIDAVYRGITQTLTKTEI